ncbi:TolC family protein [Danxiaibacter flavus]|uniref:TolC family protein n=1 Tax=Danxiaibacter flavus TaxID=3049108 RepID=A0ABV3ZHW4_9BACT|nr:TolC family protein [Chitinophagaceae bacterium DXS]
MQIKILFTLIAGICVNTMYAQTSYSLQKALQTARENNPTLKSAELNINIAQSDVITAKLRPNPVLNNQSLQLVNSSKFPADTKWYNGENRQIWWQLTKPFQLPPVRKNKIEVANQSVKLSEKLFTETQRNLFQDVALKWLDVWTARKQWDMIIIAKANVDSLVSTNQLRLKNQVISETELMRTQLLANQYELQIKNAEQNYKNELANLKLIMGVQEDIGVDTSIKFITSIPEDADSLLQQALANRSDVQSLKSTIDVANANIKLQKSLATPVPELGVIYNPQNTIPYVGFFGTIEIPIFSRNQGERKKSGIIKDQAQQNLALLQKQINTELGTSYSSYVLQKMNLEKFKAIQQKAEQILSNVKYAYLHGGTTIVDFLEAQRSWLDTQHDYYNNMQQFRESYIKLLYATGLINQLAQ